MTTNRAKFRIAESIYNSGTRTFYFALCTSATPPNPDIKTFGQLTQIPVGNGYPNGGIALSNTSVNFAVAAENDTTDKVIVTLRDIVFTAQSGSLPSSGDGARWAVLTGPGTVIGDREVWHYWDLGSDRKVQNGFPLELEAFKVEVVDV